MSLKLWLLLALAALIGFTAVNLTVGLPIMRTAGYYDLIRQYRGAVPVKPTESVGGKQCKWNFDLASSSGPKVRVEARDFMDIVRVQYVDEVTVRQLYDYEDYSSPIAIRTAGNTLFVHWGEALFHTDYWLLAYDTVNRREIARRRVDRNDLPSDPQWSCLTAAAPDGGRERQR
jgi:hypothetical protein